MPFKTAFPRDLDRMYVVVQTNIHTSRRSLLPNVFTRAQAEHRAEVLNDSTSGCFYYTVERV